MAIFSIILLLAAYSTSIIAGPVPQAHRRQLFTSYTNTTSTIFSTSEQKTAEAETAIIVEPIQQTVVTSIAPAITFVNPDGKPLVTQDPQTIFSTSFITPSPLPTTEESSSAVATPSVTPSPVPTPIESISVPISSVIGSSAFSSSVDAVDNKTASETSQQVPMFTYSPIEEETSTSLATPTAPATSAIPASTTGGLPGFTHPAAAPSNLPSANTTTGSTIASASSMIESVIQASSSSPMVNSTSLALPVPTSSGSPTAALPSETASDAIDVTSRIIVTQYTTIYATSQPPQTPAQESAMPTEAQESAPLASPTSEVASASMPSPSNAPAEVSPHANTNTRTQPDIRNTCLFSFSRTDHIQFGGHIVFNCKFVFGSSRANTHNTRIIVFNVGYFRAYTYINRIVVFRYTNHVEYPGKLSTAITVSLIHGTTSRSVFTAFLLFLHCVTSRSNCIDIRRRADTTDNNNGDAVFCITRTRAGALVDNIGRSADHHADTTESSIYSNCYCDCDGEGDG
ncbi:uncharacterized protein ALTATR162_LOCUS11129 [Alternaria atra]|uniref:Uncharacterized protein n=1 Tax=Alternaria atra TaxID=119953 RepID=A0A8J2ING6_9PLEO|nr:uncharacterized protein ALTATR162_LOCUS11129 [Alternaria atra]CAG5184882.1 unnamed protein product [Alternaria atra]